MTPAARYAAAIEILDRMLRGEAAEKALTNWGRSNRFAGSGDRFAIRDLVFEAIRCRRSFAAFGGSETGRGLILGSLLSQGIDPSLYFTGIGHAPSPVDRDELSQSRAPNTLEELDCPDWLWPYFERALGPQSALVLRALRHRATVFLRVNSAKGTREAAMQQLADEGIETVISPLSPTALAVTANARKVQNSSAYQSGLVELQDAASQAVVDVLPLRSGMRVLDYCAGGGGKSLAVAAHAGVKVTAHDINPARLNDIGPRAARAGVTIALATRQELAKAAPFDLVLVDAPCSGSGSWRRAPEAKWNLTPQRLAQIQEIQAQILEDACQLIAPDGVLAYVTCSLFREENQNQTALFLERHPNWHSLSAQLFTPIDGADGFYVELLQPNTASAHIKS